ncbi:Hypothetical protein, putative [Bodo saltans]|uniref:Calcium uniporter protein C-terminal domain-containing protein n=1 Tax=Bodo saltans TaxID=75058 RepID=A0A0S4JH33_BODSA|nr:Hypothetical protein, putative [Bodo saltans]|eukprot:CUG89244.1 Hypothetical protein, putative [Bodo saltans]
MFFVHFLVADKEQDITMLRRPLVRSAQTSVGRCLHASLTASPTPGGLKLVTSFTGASYGIADPVALKSVIDAALSRDSFLRDKELGEASIEELKKQLAPLEALEAEIDRRATAHSTRVITCIGAALAVQFAVLFNWVFVVFDWNLVEPVTYFLGYTVIWWSLVFYKRTGRDFSYEGIIEELKERKQAKLQKSLKLDANKLEELRSEIVTLEQKLRKL